jgi:predicted ATPase
MPNRCDCNSKTHDVRLIVLTGGPGAGKTAVLEIAKRQFCRHVIVLPESASILYGGGFPRRTTDEGHRSAQRAIFRVQREMERIVLGERSAALAICDRGTVDGFAYWPGTADEFWREMGTTREEELRRYHAVIHLRTPSAEDGYNHQNPIRIESAADALRIDARIAEAWEGHPRRHFIASSKHFLEKAEHAVALLRAELPECCARCVRPFSGA